MRTLLSLVLLLSSTTVAIATPQQQPIPDDVSEIKRTINEVTAVATSYPTLIKDRPGVGFLTITNGIGMDISLYGVEAPDTAETVEIHTHEDKGGMMRMVKLEELTIPAHTTLDFHDKNLHLMLMGMQKDLKAGDNYPMTLKFQKNDGSLLPIDVEVEVVER